MEISLEKFRKDHPEPRKVAFVMMRIGETKLHDEIFSGIEAALAPLGIKAIRADRKWYDHDYLLNNILTYIHGCGFGIVVFDRIEDASFNANVMFEMGYMMALEKPIGLLKDRTLKQLPSDLLGKRYVKFDPQDPVQSISRELPQWLKDTDIPDQTELGELVGLLSRLPKTEVRYLKRKSEVQAIFELGEAYYAHAAMNVEVLWRRWERYKKGIHGLFKEASLIGGIGIWPVSEERFSHLIKGKLEKSEVADFVVTSETSEKRNCWYVGNVLLKREFRGKNLQLRLLQGAARAWLDSGDVAPRVTLCGLGYSSEAIAVLSYLHFVHEGKYFKEFPVFIRSATIEELQEDYEELIVKRMWDAQVRW